MKKLINISKTEAYNAFKMACDSIKVVCKNEENYVLHGNTLCFLYNKGEEDESDKNIPVVNFGESLAVMDISNKHIVDNERFLIGNFVLNQSLRDQGFKIEYQI